MTKGSEKFSYNLAASEKFFSIQDWRLMLFNVGTDQIQKVDRRNSQ
jgi:hypothetical protein